MHEDLKVPMSGPVVIPTQTRARFGPRLRISSRGLVWGILSALACFWGLMLVLWKGLP